MTHETKYLQRLVCIKTEDQDNKIEFNLSVRKTPLPRHLVLVVCSGCFLTNYYEVFSPYDK